ncbi:Hypothetical predicted protein [Podarcis lilfordi]|uniref:Uncharacterized protein n=1 Tax=Podarcis lilfordi TaxID=74358 RepID=A0AA35JYM8_9SAUR|nr:Hypothetical predicted protein [Podarcis lilfordi]
MNGSPLSECLSLCRNCCLSGAGTLSVKIFNLCILRLFVNAHGNVVSILWQLVTTR